MKVSLLYNGKTYRDKDSFLKAIEEEFTNNEFLMRAINEGYGDDILDLIKRSDPDLYEEMFAEIATNWVDGEVNVIIE